MYVPCSERLRSQASPDLAAAKGIIHFYCNNVIRIRTGAHNERNGIKIRL